MDRRDFLVGNLTGVVLGAAVVKLAQPPAEVVECPISPEELQWGAPSFAQQGEDIVIESALKWMRVEKPTYLDIGAYHPIRGNNTYLLYREGFTGVVVEPNPAYAKMLREVRPRDVVLDVGIGFTDETAADYYVIRGKDQLNTFSKEQADAIAGELGPDAIERVVKMPLVHVNKAIEQHFGGKAPSLLSIDVEGLDLSILQALDFQRFRPTVFCVETLQIGARKQMPAIFELMAAHDYEARGGSFVNTVFVDKKLLAS